MNKMKRFALVGLFALLLAGCSQKPLSSAEASVSESVKATESTTTSSFSSGNGSEQESVNQQLPDSVTLYFFQIYCKELEGGCVRIDDGVDYRFKLTYDYGTKRKNFNSAEEICRSYPPKYTYGDGGGRTVFYTNLDPLLRDDEELKFLDHDRVIYFANIL